MKKYKGLNHEYRENVETILAISDDEINNFWDKWKYLEDQSASADSRVGWSTAFFAMLLSSLLALAFGFDTKLVWLITIPLICSTLLGITCLVWTLIPNELNRIVREKYPHEVMKYLRRYSEWTTFHDDMNEVDSVKQAILIRKFLASSAMSVEYSGHNQDYWKIWYWDKKNPLYSQFNQKGDSQDMKNRIIAKGSQIPFKANTRRGTDDYFNTIHGIPLYIALEDKDVALELLQGHITQRINLLHAAYAWAIPFMIFWKGINLMKHGSKIFKQWKINKQINATDSSEKIISQDGISVLKVFTTTSIAHFDELTDYIKTRM